MLGLIFKLYKNHVSIVFYEKIFVKQIKNTIYTIKNSVWDFYLFIFCNLNFDKLISLFINKNMFFNLYIIKIDLLIIVKI